MTSTTCKVSPPNPVTWTINNLGGFLTESSDLAVSVTYYPQKARFSNSDDIKVYLYPNFINSPVVLSDWTVTGAAGTGVYKMSQGGPLADRSDLSVQLPNNPASTQTTALVTGPSGHSATVELFNLLGACLQRVSVTAGPDGTTRCPLELSGLPTGSYTVSVVGDEGLRAHTHLSVIR